MNTETELPPENPLTLRDWLWHLLHHQDQVFVRYRNESLAFSQLPPKEQATCIDNWLQGAPVGVQKPSASFVPVNDDEWNAMLSGPLSHPFPMFTITRLVLALRTCVDAGGEPAAQALRSYCEGRNQRDNQW